MAQPPPFADLANCKKCDSGFGLFVRKHHCRNCGQTFCSSCSAKEAPLPAFNIVEAVRVCDACFEALRNPPKAAPKAAVVQRAPVAAVEEPVAASAPPPPPKKVVQKNCTCNMPLCICPDMEEPAEDKEVARPASSGSQPSVAAAVATKPKPAAAASRPSFLGSASSASSSASSSSAPKMNIDWKGDLAEQCRDAIKNGDSAAVALLLDRGQVPATWVDRQGQTLLHLAAMFNRTDVCMMLLQKGANAAARNGQNEGVLDVAPPSLANKIKAFKAST